MFFHLAEFSMSSIASSSIPVILQPDRFHTPRRKLKIALLISLIALSSFLSIASFYSASFVLALSNTCIFTILTAAIGFFLIRPKKNSKTAAASETASPAPRRSRLSSQRSRSRTYNPTLERVKLDMEFDPAPNGGAYAPAPSGLGSQPKAGRNPSDFLHPQHALRPRSFSVSCIPRQHSPLAENPNPK